MTIREMRDALREIDMDANGKICFIEYCLFKYKKTLTELFAEKPQNLAALLKALDEAIAAHEEALAKRKEVEDKMAALEATAAEGSGVKAMKARAELEQLRARSQTGQNMAEVRSAYMKKKAAKDLENGDPAAEEMKRVAAEKAKREEEEKAKRAESKAKLAAKAAAFAGN